MSSFKGARERVRALTKLFHEENADGSIDVATGFDGSWKKRGHSAHEGVISAVAEDTAQVLDVEHLINYCRYIFYMSSATGTADCMTLKRIYNMSVKL